jgi:hypothetical protein
MATTPQATSGARYKLGTNRITQHHSTLTNINRHLRRSPVVPTGEVLARVLSAALHQQTQHGTNTTCPRRAGRSPGSPAQERLRLGRVGVVWHPLDLLEGYHTPAQGQSQTTHTPVLLKAAPGLPCGRAAPDRRDAAQPQRARSIYGAVTGPSNVEKY